MANDYNHAATKCPSGAFEQCVGPQCAIFVREVGKCSLLVLAESKLSKPASKSRKKKGG